MRVGGRVSSGGVIEDAAARWLSANTLTFTSVTFIENNNLTREQTSGYMIGHNPGSTPGWGLGYSLWNNVTSYTSVPYGSHVALGYTGPVIWWGLTTNYAGLAPQPGGGYVTFDTNVANGATGLLIRRLFSQQLINLRVVLDGSREYYFDSYGEAFVIDNITPGVHTLTISLNPSNLGGVWYLTTMGLAIDPIKAGSVTCTDSWDTETTDKHGRPSSTNHDQDIPCDVFEDCGPENPC